MQTALQNPHYKKIWEKVIMNNHPTAKSFEEALKMEEIYKLHCEVLLRYENVTEIINVEKRNSINIDLLKQAQQNGVAEFKILGRQITLFDILSLLNNMNQQNYCFTSDGYGIYHTTENNYLHRVRKVCDFNTNLLEETTPETWEKIANLID